VVCKVGLPENLKQAALHVTFVVRGKDTVRISLACVLKKCKGSLKPSDFYFKERGLESYLYGDLPITAFGCVRVAMMKKRRLELMLIRKPTVKVRDRSVYVCVCVCVQYIDNNPFCSIYIYVYVCIGLS